MELVKRIHQVNIKSQ